MTTTYDILNDLKTLINNADIMFMSRITTLQISRPPVVQKYSHHPGRTAGVALLMAGTLGLTGPVWAGSVTAPVTARIVSMVNLVTLSGMQFGEISASSAPGTIVLEPGGARTSTQGATLNSAVPGGPASFEIIGTPSSTYIVSLPISVRLTSSNGESMEVNQLTSLPSQTGQLDGGGRQTLFVGGTLNINANQLYGSYSGVMSVTVEYN